MDNSLYFIAVIFLVLAALLALFFYRMNLSLKSKYELRCDELKDCYQAHQDQIEFRQITLGAYDFDRFNLSQVLQKQKLVQCL